MSVKIGRIKLDECTQIRNSWNKVLFTYIFIFLNKVCMYISIWIIKGNTFFSICRCMYKFHWKLKWGRTKRKFMLTSLWHDILIMSFLLHGWEKTHVLPFISSSISLNLLIFTITYFNFNIKSQVLQRFSPSKVFCPCPLLKY